MMRNWKKLKKYISKAKYGIVQLVYRSMRLRDENIIWFHVHHLQHQKGLRSKFSWSLVSSAWELWDSESHTAFLLGRDAIYSTPSKQNWVLQTPNSHHNCIVSDSDKPKHYYTIFVVVFIVSRFSVVFSPCELLWSVVTRIKFTESSKVFGALTAMLKAIECLNSIHLLCFGSWITYVNFAFEAL